jgi:cell shape-determining protein MreC
MNINLEIEKLKNKIKLLEKENKKLKEKIEGYIIYEGELKSQLTTEKCNKY